MEHAAEPQLPKLNKEESLKILRSIVRGVSRDYGIDVRLVTGEGDAYFNWKDHYVGVNEKNLSRNLDVQRGLAAHEGKHVAITVGEMVPEEDMLHTGFGQLLQTVEDVRVNSSTERDLPGAGDWIRKAMIDFTKEGEERDIKVATERLTGELGFTPRSLEFTMALQNSWALGEFGIPLHDETKEALDKIMPWIEKIKADVPLPGAKKSEVRESMWRNYTIQKTHIWPVFAELIEKDKQDIEDLQFIKYLSSDEGSMELEIVNMDLTPEEREELAGIVAETREKFPPPPPEEPKKEEDSGQLNFMDLNKMSGSLRTKLENAKKQINSKKQEQFESEAEEKMKELEDKIIEALRSKLQDPKNNETNQEREIRLLQEAQYQKDALQAALDIKAAREKQGPPPSRYQEILNQVSDEIDDLVDKLQKVLLPNKFPRWKKGFASGGRLTMPRVMQYAADKRGYNQLWEKKTLPHKKDYGATILLDLSTSMSQDILNDQSEIVGNKLTEALKAVVIFSEALNRLGIPFEVLGYSSERKQNGTGYMDRENKLVVLKEFREEFGDDIREKIGSVQVIGWTPTGWGVQQASERIVDYGCKQPIIVNVTDGAADDRSILKLTVDDIDDNTNQLLIGLGIGGGIDPADIENIYRHGKHVPNVKDLPSEITNVLEEAIY